MNKKYFWTLEYERASSIQETTSQIPGIGRAIAACLPIKRRLVEDRECVHVPVRGEEGVNEWDTDKDAELPARFPLERDAVDTLH